MCRCGTRETTRHVANSTTIFPSNSECRLWGRGWPLSRDEAQSRANNSRGSRLCHYWRCSTALVEAHCGSLCEIASAARPSDQSSLVLSWVPCNLIVHLVFYTFCRIWNPSVLKHSIFWHFDVNTAAVTIYIYIICMFYFYLCVHSMIQFHKWQKCISRTRFSNASINVFKLCGICWYVMQSRFLSSYLTCRCICNICEFLTE